MCCFCLFVFFVQGTWVCGESWLAIINTHHPSSQGWASRGLVIVWNCVSFVCLSLRLLNYYYIWVAGLSFYNNMALPLASVFYTCISMYTCTFTCTCSCYKFYTVMYILLAIGCSRPAFLEPGSRRLTSTCPRRRRVDRLLFSAAPRQSVNEWRRDRDRKRRY